MATTLSAETIAEINRKAKAGIALTNQTAEAMAVYNKVKPTTTTPSAETGNPEYDKKIVSGQQATGGSTLSAETIAEINRKAKAGIALTNQTAEAMAVYNKVRPTTTTPAWEPGNPEYDKKLAGLTAGVQTAYDKNTFGLVKYDPAFANQVNTGQQVTGGSTLPQYQDQSGRISESYDAQLAAQVASLQNARDTANAGYNTQIEEAPQVYGEQRAGADLNTARNLQALNETSAAKGTAFSGGVASDQGGLRVAGDTQKASLTQSEINFVNNIKKAIADNNRSSSYAEIEATANATAQKNAALAAESQNVYRAGQDTFNNNITMQNLALNTAATEASIKQADAATASTLLQTEISSMQQAAMLDPDSPENQTVRIALEKAQLELDNLKVAGKYTEEEAKAQLELIWANIRQSDASAASSKASAANSNASAAATKSEMEIKEEAAKVVTSGRVPSTSDIKNAADNIRATAGTDRSTKSYDQGGETTNTSSSLDVATALNGLRMLEAAGWDPQYIKEVAAQLGIVINQ